jgi:hypothetical protein
MNVDNSLCHNDNCITETKIFNVSVPGEPIVQFVVNIFKDKRATVKLFMPQYPAEHSFTWLRERFGDKAMEINKKVQDYIVKRGAYISYYGY